MSQSALQPVLPQGGMLGGPVPVIQITYDLPPNVVFSAALARASLPQMSQPPSARGLRCWRTKMAAIVIGTATAVKAPMSPMPVIL